jgi:hypothetical protein
MLDHTPNLPDSSWPDQYQKPPLVLAKGIMFDRHIEVTVECKVSSKSRMNHFYGLSVPKSLYYPYVITELYLRLFIHDLSGFIPGGRHHPTPPYYDK